jgi:hypothetical protein
MRLQGVADLDRQLADPRDNRLQGRDERQHDLPARLHFELVGSALGAAAQPRQQLAGGLAAGIPVALEKRRKALLTETASIDR